MKKIVTILAISLLVSGGLFARAYFSDSGDNLPSLYVPSSSEQTPVTTTTPKPATAVVQPAQAPKQVVVPVVQDFSIPVPQVTHYNALDGFQSTYTPWQYQPTPTTTTYTGNDPAHSCHVGWGC